MSEVQFELREIAEQLYTDLRRLAKKRLRSERNNHTLQTTALINEVYLRLAESNSDLSWTSRANFFSHAAETMRRVLIDSARASKCLKRGGEWQRIPFSDAIAISNTADADVLLDLEEGLMRLEKEDPLSAELVKYRVFAGLTIVEAGELLGLSRTSAYDTWSFVTSWFQTFAKN